MRIKNKVQRDKVSIYIFKLKFNSEYLRYLHLIFCLQYNCLAFSLQLKIFLDANKASIKHADDIISAVDKQLKNIDNLLHDYKDFFEENIINNSDSFSLGKIAPDNYDEK